MGRKQICKKTNRPLAMFDVCSIIRGRKLRRGGTMPSCASLRETGREARPLPRPRLRSRGSSETAFAWERLASRGNLATTFFSIGGMSPHCRPSSGRVAPQRARCVRAAHTGAAPVFLLIFTGRRGATSYGQRAAPSASCQGALQAALAASSLYLQRGCAAAQCRRRCQANASSSAEADLPKNICTGPMQRSQPRSDEALIPYGPATISAQYTVYFEPGA
jgi:hypothetical protein